MTTDQRQQELFIKLFKLDSRKFNEWFEQQPDKEMLRELLAQCWAYTVETGDSKTFKQYY